MAGRPGSSARRQRLARQRRSSGITSLKAIKNAIAATKHIPALAAVPGVLSARRFKDPNGTHRYLAPVPREIARGHDGRGLEKRGRHPVDRTAEAALPRSPAHTGAPYVRAK